MVSLLSIPTKLDGGTLVSRDPNRIVSPYVEPAYMRMIGSMDLYLSAACIVLFRQAALLNLGIPDTEWAEVAVREIDGVKYILVAPTDEKNPRRVPLTRPKDNSGMIRTADDVLLDAGIAMLAGFTYKLSASLVEDATYRNVVAVSWTHAEQEPQG
jgi:hypothetical protein